jgi:hypothetical protein
MQLFYCRRWSGFRQLRQAAGLCEKCMAARGRRTMNRGGKSGVWTGYSAGSKRGAAAPMAGVPSAFKNYLEGREHLMGVPVSKKTWARKTRARKV